MRDLSFLRATMALLAMPLSCSTGASNAANTNSMGGAAGGGMTAAHAAAGPIVGMTLAAFDSDISGFRIDTFAEPANLAFGTGTRPTLDWVAAEGSPDPGCLQITAPFSAANQYVDLESPILTPLQDWSNKTLHVRIKVDPNSTFAGSPDLYVKTGSSYFFYPTVTSTYPESAGWQEFVFPLVSPAPAPPAVVGADPAQVISYGFHPSSGSAPAVTPTSVTFFLDSFSIE